MQKSVICNVPAKLNLSLLITGKHGNLHTIESVMTSIALYDTVTAIEKDLPTDGGAKNADSAETVRRAESENGETNADCADCKNPENSVNLVLQSDNAGFVPSLYERNIRRAIDKFTARFGGVSADITVHNRIRLGAGIGGSTAGVVGVLKCLAQLKNVALDNEFLLSVGSDAPFMATGGTCLVSGVGEKVEKLKNPQLFYVLLFPNGGVDSGEAYALYDQLKKEQDEPHGIAGKNECDREGKKCANNADNGVGLSKIGAVRYCKIPFLPFDCLFENHLQAPALKLNENIAPALNALLDTGAKNVLMSGSGSAVFAVFDERFAAEKVYQTVRFDGDKLLVGGVQDE